MEDTATPSRRPLTAFVRYGGDVVYVTLGRHSSWALPDPDRQETADIEFDSSSDADVLCAEQLVLNSLLQARDEFGATHARIMGEDPDIFKHWVLENGYSADDVEGRNRRDHPWTMPIAIVIQFQQAMVDGLTAGNNTSEPTLA